MSLGSTESESIDDCFLWIYQRWKRIQLQLCLAGQIETFNSMQHGCGSLPVPEADVTDGESKGSSKYSETHLLSGLRIFRSRSPFHVALKFDGSQRTK